ncbi:hypothetical protein R1sor_011029 [Riccia sorocarpa]|uniref:DUF659 domain-containing protein n=1 Tax=Riccia sorocarpa TaxID=122646 RepID=A0ABD3I022_9MARC
MMYDHADGSNVTKDAKWVAANMLKVIREIGPINVLQFTADNAVVNSLAGQIYIVRAEFPHIVFGGCVAHGIDLLFEDMAKRGNVTQTWDYSTTSIIIWIGLTISSIVLNGWLLANDRRHGQLIHAGRQRQELRRKASSKSFSMIHSGTNAMMCY